jgi:hypothetical protein
LIEYQLKKKKRVSSDPSILNALRIDEQVSKHGMTLGNNTLRFSN